MKPAGQKVLDAKDAAQLQHAPFHYSMEVWINRRIRLCDQDVARPPVPAEQPGDTLSLPGRKVDYAWHGTCPL